ncbi:Short-chain dehydrogenase/reductase family protein [Mycena venus]|uniref:Short-chain dehydrogenase/reductase family protein n=1 Tax=Mycena venus TaxID=2733690 RepID=A0A8H6YQG3_9AGAR|nr:Short-chain dehydrogenase/reductase family protein [Mycena venus]
MVVRKCRSHGLHVPVDMRSDRQQSSRSHPWPRTTATTNLPKMGAVLARISPPKFRPERDVPDLSGKIIIVTGGNTGIGYETVKQLLLKNAKVYLGARSAEKGAAAIKSLEKETGNSAIFLQLDLADLPSVRAAAETFLSHESRLDILFNNAGVMMCPTDQLTAQNHDLQFGTNVIGHFFFTELLLPALTKSYEETQVPARVIHTSSAGHAFAPGNGIDFVSLRGGPERDAWVNKKGNIMSRVALYGESKIGNIIISNYFAKTHSAVLVSCALHPGGIKTELQRHAASWLQALGNAFLYPAPMGAYTQLWGATVATPAQITGQYLVPWGKVAKADKRASNTKLEQEVVDYIKDQIKDF